MDLGNLEPDLEQDLEPDLLLPFKTSLVSPSVNLTGFTIRMELLVLTVEGNQRQPLLRRASLLKSITQAEPVRSHSRCVCMVEDLITMSE